MYGGGALRPENWPEPLMLMWLMDQQRVDRTDESIRVHVKLVGCVLVRRWQRAPTVMVTVGHNTASRAIRSAIR